MTMCRRSRCRSTLSKVSQRQLPWVQTSFKVGRSCVAVLWLILMNGYNLEFSLWYNFCEACLNAIMQGFFSFDDDVDEISLFVLRLLQVFFLLALDEFFNLNRDPCNHSQFWGNEMKLNSSYDKILLDSTHPCKDVKTQNSLMNINSKFMFQTKRPLRMQWYENHEELRKSRVEKLIKKYVGSFL